MEKRRSWIIKNYRQFGYGYKKRCLQCDIKSCKNVEIYRKDVYTKVEEGMETAKCSKCKKKYSVNDFYKNRVNKSGRESQYKNCSSKNKNRVLNDGILKKMRRMVKQPDGIGDNEKWCGDCQKVKNKSEYRKRKTAKDWYQTYYRDCDNARTRRNRMRRKITGGKNK